MRPIKNLIDINTYKCTKESPVHIINKVDCGDVGWNVVAQERSSCFSKNYELLITGSCVWEETIFGV